MVEIFLGDLEHLYAPEPQPGEGEPGGPGGQGEPGGEQSGEGEPGGEPGGQGEPGGEQSGEGQPGGEPGGPGEPGQTGGEPGGPGGQGQPGGQTGGETGEGGPGGGSGGTGEPGGTGEGQGGSGETGGTGEPGSKKDKVGGGGRNISVDEREKLEKILDELKDGAGADPQDSREKTISNADEERGTNSSSNVKKEDVEKAAQVGKGKETEEQTNQVNNELDKSKKEGKEKDYLDEIIGLNPPLVKNPQRVIGILQRIMLKCLHTKEMFDPARPRRTGLLKTPYGDEYQQHGSDTEIMSPAILTMVLDASGSIHIGMFKKVLVAIVSILHTVHLFVEEIHVIGFAADADYKKVKFPGRTTNPKDFFNKMAMAYGGFKVTSSSTHLESAYNMIVSKKCFDSDLFFVFSDFLLHDNIRGESSLKSVSRKIMEKTIYIQVPIDDKKKRPSFDILRWMDVNFKERYVLLNKAVMAPSDND